MANFLSKAASYGGFGGVPGAYATNKGFRNQANEFLFGKESEMKPFNEQSLNDLLQMIMSGGGLQGNANYQGGSDFLQRLFANDPEMMQQFQQPYMQNFEQNIIPTIAERFAGMGTGGGASSSSGLQNSLAQAGRGLQTDLAAMRGQMQLNALPQSLAYAQQPITNRLQANQLVPQQYYEMPGQAGAVQSGLNSFLNGFSKSFSGGF